MAGRWALAIHGGAGTIRRADRAPEVERPYLEALDRILAGGEAILSAGGTALDAVAAAVAAFEDCPLFNCGRGAVFAADGRIALDAAIMDGRTLAAGAVAGVWRVRNPVRLARAVMERTSHVLLIGDGAEALAREQGIELVDAAYFETPRRRAQLVATRQGPGEDVTSLSEDARFDPPDDSHMGTAGAVALDVHGHLAAGTSTGGLTNQRPGRVGDTPIIGAGTYADDATCAVSGTGKGEVFIRACVAHEVAARMRWAGQTLEQASAGIVSGTLQRIGGPGTGGLIAVDAQGNVAMPFNSEGMYRGCAGSGRERTVAIHQPARTHRG